MKLADILNQVRYLPRAVSLVWHAARPWTMAWLTLLVIQGVLPIVTVYLTRAVVDSLVGALGGGRDWVAIQPTLIWVGLIALVLLPTCAVKSRVSRCGPFGYNVFQTGTCAETAFPLCTDYQCQETRDGKQLQGQSAG